MQIRQIHIALALGSLGNELLGVSENPHLLMSSGCQWPRDNDGVPEFKIQRAPVLGFPFLVIRSYQEEPFYFFQMPDSIELFSENANRNVSPSSAAGVVYRVNGEWFGGDGDEGSSDDRCGAGAVERHEVDEEYLSHAIYWAKIWRDYFEKKIRG